MVFDRSLRTLFDKVPAIYHSSRKGYPPALFKDIIKIACLPPSALILDVGCGSGLSSSYFVEKKYAVTGIDMSNELITVAEKNIGNKGNAVYIHGDFETYPFKDESFDLIISGQAFHWLDEAIAYTKCASLLKNGGHLAIFAKFHDYRKSTFLRKLRAIFIESCTYYPSDLHHDDYSADYLKELEQTQLFFTPVAKKYSYFIAYTLEDYRNYILSNSWMVKLDDSKREKVMKKIDLLMAQYSWPMKVPFGSALVIAQVALKN